MASVEKRLKRRMACAQIGRLAGRNLRRIARAFAEKCVEDWRAKNTLISKFWYHDRTVLRIMRIDPKSLGKQRSQPHHLIYQGSYSIVTVSSSEKVNLQNIPKNHEKPFN